MPSLTSSEDNEESKKSDKSENEFWDPHNEKRVVAYRETAYEVRKELNELIEKN